MRIQTYHLVYKHQVSQSVARKNGGCRVERRQPDTKIVGRYVIKKEASVKRKCEVVLGNIVFSLVYS